VIVSCLGVAAAMAAPADSTGTPGFRIEDEPTWAVGAAFRTALIPFASEERTVATFIPFVFYDGRGPFYFRGLEGGVRFWRPGDWQFSAMTRIRFFDIPQDLQNQIQGDTFFYGLQARYAPFGPWHLDLEVLGDLKGHELANARLGGFWERRKWWAKAYFQAQYKTSRFNTRYYGLELEDAGAGVELGVGASFMYSVASNFFLFARGEAALLDGAARDVSFVNRDATAQGFLGFGFKNDRTRTTPSVRKSKPHLRLAHGWVTPSSLADIMSFKAESDPDNHQMTSIFYGHPVSDTLLGIPIQVYMHTGLGWYWANLDPGAMEFVIAAKLYYTIPLPVRLKLGFAEGWSWVTDIPYVENTELRAKGYEPSPLLNYLDFSVDVNMGDLFGWIGARETLDRTWLGYDIHHRSAIFESAQQFGRIKGGSNVQMVYLQYDF
jgi:outer membrane protein